MAITAKLVQELRQATGLGMMECKKALEEANGDLAAAAEIVRKKYGAKMAGRSDRESTEGKVAVTEADDKTVLVQVNTETDFTANNDAFGEMVSKIADLAVTQEPGDVSKTNDMEAIIEEVRVTTQENIQFAKGIVFGGAGKNVGSYIHFTGKIGVMVEVEGEASEELLKDLCMHISAISPTPLGVTIEEIPAELIEKEKAFAKQEAIESGKPEQIAEKMVEGKMRKYLDTVTLLRQPFVKDDKKQVQDLLPNGTTITRFARYQVGG